MPCIALRDESGKQIGWAKVCGAIHLCWFCRERIVTKLCDFPLGNGKTCSAKMCNVCATEAARPVTPRKSRHVDYCPTHKGQVAIQSQLFQEVHSHAG
jgi:hypothetical protein